MIHFDHVKKLLDGSPVLEVETLHIPKGSIYGLIGANGAGKSTMLRLLSGVYFPDGGVLSIENENIMDNPKIKEKVFFVSDEPYFLPQANLDEMASFFQTYYSKFSPELYQSFCEDFGLPRKKKIAAYSKGMKRQAIILLALSCQPEYLLLDESFDGLDPVVRQKVKRIIIDFALQKDITVVISSHNLRELDEFCDSVGIIYKGKVLYDITLDQLKEKVHKYQMVFSEPVTEDAFSRFHLLSCEIVGKFATIVIKGDRETLERKINALEPMALEEFSLGLEEIFVYEMEAKGYDYKNIFA